MFGRSVFLTLAFLGCLAAPVISLAQNSGDAGVSGIPRGPGNVGGLNNSINDPSGSGNRIAAPPPPSMAVPTVPSAAPAISTRAPPGSARVVRRVDRNLEPTPRKKSRRKAAREAAHVDDKQLDRKLRSICRGC
ncbi:MAG: hypothetical protein QOH32_3569 [Bradyrhizobium sp.]|jgi:hypothetical protein|nr:hypothetical protein [Bradyrhizobium sp.]